MGLIAITNAHADHYHGRTSKSGRKVETREFAAFARRIVRAFGRRIAAGDVDALPELLQLQAELDAVLDTTVRGLRQQGYSWQEIADRTGTSRQAAHKRWSAAANA